MRDGFTLEGTNYRQEYRKCGKPTCKRCTDGDGHGPYWYAFDNMTGGRRYIGRELPAPVAGARANLQAQRRELQAQRDRLARQVKAIDALLNLAHLGSSERETLTWLGFGDCLVSSPAAAHTQETPRPASTLLFDIL